MLPLQGADCQLAILMFKQERDIHLNLASKEHQQAVIFR
jgi:hypothetical protein